MSFVVDTSELKDFNKKLKKLSAEMKNEFFIDCGNELSARVLRRVAKRTPVGVKPEKPKERTARVKGKSGKSRTFLTPEAALYEQYWAGYVGGTLRRGWVADPTRRYGSAYIAKVYNNVKYARYVEYGHRQKVGRYVPALGKRLKKSWVKGQYMLRDSEKEIKEIAPELMRRRLNSKLKEVFN